MHNRWKTLVSFVNTYLARPLDSESGNTLDAVNATERRLGCELPLSVREWYQLVGCRADVTCADDRITRLDDLQTNDSGFLSLYWESQMSWDCGIRMSESKSTDPPAYFKSSELDYVTDYGLPEESIVYDSLVRVAPNVSFFLTHMAILQRLIAGATTNWKPEVFCGCVQDEHVADGVISDFQCIKVFEVPWGHSLYSSGRLLLEKTNGEFRND